MNIDIDENRRFVLSEIYCVAAIKTDAGTFSICQRDAGIEIRLGEGPWFTWQEESGPTVLKGQ